MADSPDTCFENRVPQRITRQSRRWRSVGKLVSGLNGVPWARKMGTSDATKVFATFAIFSISRDFSTARRSTRRAEKWKRVRVPVFVGLRSTLWFLTTLPRIEKVTSDVMKVLVARVRSSLFWESASARRPFFSSTITFPSLMDRIVRARIATKRGKCVSVSRWRLLPGSTSSFDRWFTSPERNRKGWNCAGTSKTTLALKSTAASSDTSILFLFNIFFYFLNLELLFFSGNDISTYSFLRTKVSQEIRDWYFKASEGIVMVSAWQWERAESGSHEGDNLFVGANKSVGLDQPEQGKNFINSSVRGGFKRRKKKIPFARRRAYWRPSDKWNREILPWNRIIWSWHPYPLSRVLKYPRRFNISNGRQRGRLR